LDTALPYWVCADRFGWTPSQVDAESRLKVWAVVLIDDVVQELKSQRSGNQSVEALMAEAGAQGRRR